MMYCICVLTGMFQALHLSTSQENEECPYFYSYYLLGMVLFIQNLNFFSIVDKINFQTVITCF